MKNETVNVPEHNNIEHEVAYEMVHPPVRSGGQLIQIHYKKNPNCPRCQGISLESLLLDD